MTIIFYPEHPYQSLSFFVSGVVMIIIATVVIFQIKNNSKNNFAYTLMGMTVLLGIANVG